MSTKSISKLNISVVGCGNWGKNLIRVLYEANCLHSVCDADLDKAALYGKQFNVPYYDDLDTLLNTTELDALFIATPSITHYTLAKRCLDANKHVYIEKPLATSIEDACHLYELATQKNRVLMVGHLLQYHPAFNALKQLNDEGHLGKLQTLYSKRLNLGKFITEKNIWWDYAPHDVSMILSLTKELPNRVFAMGGNYLKHTSMDMTCTQLSFAGGAQAHIFVSWLHPYKEQQLVVVGDKAMAVFNDSAPWEEKLKLYPYPAEWVDGLPQPCISQAQNIPLSIQEPLKNEVNHFIESVKYNKTPLTDGIEGLQVMQVLNAAAQSLESKQPVSLASNQAFRKSNGSASNNIPQRLIKKTFNSLATNTNN